MGRGTRGTTNYGWRRIGVEDTISATIDGSDILGGDVLKLIAGAATLKVGELVYFSASRTVTKTATATTSHANVCGVVVSGWQLGMQIPHDASAVGLNAALTGEPVLVCVNGVVYVVCDAAIAAGLPIAPSTTVAGRVRVATALSEAGGGIGSLALTGAPDIGTLAVSAPTKGTLEVASGATPVESSAANGDILTGAPGGAALSGAPGIGTLALTGTTSEGALSGDGLQAAVIIGKLIEASTGAGQVRAAYIHM